MTLRPGLAAVLVLAATLGAGWEPPAPAVEPAAAPVRAVVERVIGGEGSARRGLWQWMTGASAAELFVRPYGVAWDGDDLLVTDPTAARVLRVSPRGRIVSSPPGLFLGPIGVARCPGGIVVTDSRQGSVTLVDDRLRLVRRLSEGLSRPTGVGCMGKRIFVVETGAHRILVLRPEGEIADVFGRRGGAAAQFNFPAALATDAESVWIGDTLNFRVQRLRNSNGAYLRAFGRLGDGAGETPRIKGIAVDGAGRIWVTDAHLDQIAVFGGSGELLADLGRSGAGPGEFAFPAGIAAHRDGRIAVVDSLNRRIQVLRLEGAGTVVQP